MYSTDIALQLANVGQLSSMTSWNSGRQTNCTRQLSFAALPVSIRPYRMGAGNDPLPDQPDACRDSHCGVPVGAHQRSRGDLALPALIPLCG